MEEDPQVLAQRLALKFKAKHGVDCAVAIHLNAAKTNYHAHLIFSERVLLNDQRVSIASRNTYFDAVGKRSTKAKCVGADGKLLPGCRMVQKGETFPVKHFSGKNGTLASKVFLKAEKQRYAEYFTQKTNDRWEVYNYNTNPHIQLLNLVNGENKSLRAWKEAENAKRKQYNAGIDRAIDAGELTLEQAIELKKQVYLEIAEAREKRASERELWKRWFDEFPERRTAWVEQRRKEWEKLHYNSFGMRRSIFELAVILAFTVVGVDVLKVNIDDNLMVKPPARDLKAKVDPKLQEMVDQLCIASGRKAPSEQLAEKKIQKLVDVDERKLSLAERIDGAEKIRDMQDVKEGKIENKKRELH